MGTALLFVLAAALVIAGGAPMSAGTVGSYLLLLAGVVAIASSIITLINGGNFVQKIRSGLFLLSGAIFVVSAVTGSSTIFAVAAVLAALAMVADTLSLWVGKLYGAMYISAILAAVELFFAIMAISQGTAFYQGFALIIVGAWVALSTIISSMLSGPQDGARNEREVSARKEASKVSAPKEVKAISPAEESASKPKDIVPKTEPKAVEEPKVTEEPPKKVEEPIIAVAPTIEEPEEVPKVDDPEPPVVEASKVVEEPKVTEEPKAEPVPEESPKKAPAKNDFMMKLVSSRDASNRASVRPTPKVTEEPKAEPVPEEPPKKVEEPIIAVAPTIEEPVVEPQVQDEVEPSSDESVEDEHATDEEVIESVPEEPKVEPEEIAEEIIVEVDDWVGDELDDIVEDAPIFEEVEPEVVEAESEMSIEVVEPAVDEVIVEGTVGDEPESEEPKAEPEKTVEDTVVEEVESVVIDDEPVLEMEEDEPEDTVEVEPAVDERAIEDASTSEEVESVVIEEPAVVEPDSEVVEAESEISIEEADVSEPDVEAPEQVIEADWSSEEPEILDISGDGDRYQDEAVIEVIEDRPEEDAPSIPGPAPAVEEEEVLGEDLFTDYSPEAVVRRAAWNKGLRCRRDYGPYNIPVAFVKGKVAVFVVPADADTSMDAALIDEGWTILRYDEALVTDGKVQGEEIAATVKLKLREIKATTKGKKKSTKK